MPKPHEFADAPALHENTQMYTQGLGPGFGNNNYKFTLSNVLTFLTGRNFVQVFPGEYPDDASAALDSIPVGGLYELSEDNIYGVPAGVLKKRKV